MSIAWDALAARLRPFIRRRVANPADADDVLQEVLLRMHRGLPALQDEDRLIPWTYRIARTAIADHLRSRVRHPLASAAGADDGVAGAGGGGAQAGGRAGAHGDAGAQYSGAGAQAGATVDPFAEDGDAVAREVASYLAFFVELLPAPSREAVTLTELEGLTQREAAERLGLSLSGVKSRVQRGRARLRQMLEACCEVAVDARGKVVACELRDLDDVPTGCCE